MDQTSNSDIVGIRVYYDFASTLCYVAHRVLSEVDDQITRVGVELEWCPIDLTMIVPWNRGDSFAEDVRSSVRNTAMTLGVDIEMPDPWLDSRPASNIALAMPSREAEARWRTSVFNTIYERGQVELTSEQRELELELIGEGSRGETADGQSLVEQSTLNAIALGVNGVPTFILDDLVFGGVYDGESMVSVLAQLAKQHREMGAGTVN